jgi:hypothetical protein
MFSVANLIAMAGWLLLIAAPRKAAAISVAATGIPLLLASAYLVLIAVSWRGSSGGFSSLAGVSALFSNPWLLLAGWVHYLAFDLFVGAWETRDAMERSISRWLLVPCLFLTFMFGPIGWLSYRLVSAVHGGAAAGQPRASGMPRQIPA